MKKAAKWAQHVGLRLIQLLPLNDTTATHTWKDSYPYAAISVFALHPLYLHLPALATVKFKHLLKKYEAQRIALNALEKVDYEAALAAKWTFIKEIYPFLKEKTFSSKEYQSFFTNNKNWLKPYACFCCLRDWYKTADFTSWKENIYTDALAEILTKSAFDEIAIHYFVQYHLHKQLKDAVDFAHEHKVVLKGDIAIGVYRNSVDVWQDASLYHSDLQAGAPPDDFAVTGQNWGFPTYNWQRMKATGYDWWKKRLQHTSQYFDAIRIDHILGFFRIWSIPTTATEGILGYFDPAVPVSKYELQRAGAHFPLERLSAPFVHYSLLKDIFSDEFDNVIGTFFDAREEGLYHFKTAFNTQRKIVDYFSKKEKNTHNGWLQKSLLDLHSNVILIPADDTGELFHFRFNMQHTTSFQYLNNDAQNGLSYLYNDYFFKRQNALWKHEALEKLPALKHASDMLVCGEDLGFTPDSVPEVMAKLGLLGLYIQRMPKKLGDGFENLMNVPYLSVVSSSTHDTSSIRGWWQQLDRYSAQQYYNNALCQCGEAPDQNDCPDWLNKLIIQKHIQSPAMWSIFLLQDLLNIRSEHRVENADDEQINHPENSNQYWRYKMPLSLEELNHWQDFNQELKSFIQENGR